MQNKNKPDQALSIENLIFDVLDRCKFLFFPEQWNQLFLDFSKNDVFALLLVYRRKQVNVTEIAEYLQAPLNTVTGVISRLEKKGVILRERSREDKRVVTVSLSELGQQLMAGELRQINRYYLRIMEEISPEEKALLFGLIEKVFRLLQQDFRTLNGKAAPPGKVRHITIE